MKTLDLVYVGLFAALTAVLGLLPPVPVPGLPVPITAQTLGVMLAGSILGAKRGGLALLVFVVLVAIGLPVLPGGRGGLGVFLGPSGGFVAAFPVAAAVIGGLMERFCRRPHLPKAIAINIVGGIGVVYAIGVPWLAVAANLSLVQALAGSAAFIPGDVVKAVLASVTLQAVWRAMPDLKR
ncbi:MAG: biotin transporter BioY [Leptolyngbya sp. DLM2.Bin15]|nr:MAG: biotin transporter BioY [Leptolyngbya sp. DLM2.Bin15]